MSLCIIKQTDMFRWTECWGLIEAEFGDREAYVKDGLDCSGEGWLGGCSVQASWRLLSCCLLDFGVVASRTVRQ